VLYDFGGFRRTDEKPSKKKKNILILDYKKNPDRMPRHQESKIHIAEANFDDIVECASIALVGKRRSGKTTWGRILCHTVAQKVSRFVVICGTKECKQEWQKNIPDMFISDKDEKYLQDIVRYQNSKVENGRVPENKRICIILDDVGSDSKFMKMSVMKDLMSNGRHYGITILILLQYMVQLPSENRANLDYVGILSTNNASSVKRIQSEFAGCVSLRVFEKILVKTTSNRGLMWINNTIPSQGQSTAKIEGITYKFYKPEYDELLEKPICTLKYKRFKDDGKDGRKDDGKGDGKDDGKDGGKYEGRDDGKEAEEDTAILNSNGLEAIEDLEDDLSVLRITHQDYRHCLTIE
jgi:hypothetical protein